MICLEKDVVPEFTGDVLEIYYCNQLVATINQGDVSPDLLLPYYDYIIKNGGTAVDYGTAFTKRKITL